MGYQYIKIVDLDTATADQLNAAIDQNSRTYSLMSQEIANIKRVNEAAKAKSQQQPVILVEEEITQPTEKDDFDQDFEEEVEFYSAEVKKLTKEQLSTDLVKALPSRKHYEYERILRRIQAELLKECKDIREFIALESPTDMQEVQEFLDDLTLQTDKIQAIGTELTRKEEAVTAEETIDNTLVFVPTSGGNIRILDDIDAIDIAQYRRFEQLLNSIKDGTFKNVKKFHGDLAGLAEVRDLSNGARVTFMRLNDNTYAVISAFIKKTMNSNGYQKMVANQYQSYRMVEDQLKTNITNPEFIELNKGYEQELFRKLNPTALSKPAVLKKVGEKDAKLS